MSDTHFVLPSFQRHFWRNNLLLLLSLSLSACQPPAEKTTAASGTPSAQSSNSETILPLSEAAIANAALAWQVSGPQKISQSRDFPGRIALDEHRVQAVAAKVSGQARQLEKHLGQLVRTGEVLAIIESRELADLRLEYRQQQKALQLAQKQLERENALSARIQQLITRLQSGGEPGEIHQAVLNLQIGQHKARLISDYARLKLARQHLAREETLLQDQLSTRQTLQSLQEALASAQAAYSGGLEEVIWERESLLLTQRQQVQQLQQALETHSAQLRSLGVDPGLQLPPEQLAKLVLRAPQNGMVVEKPVTEGQGVSADQTLYVLADLSQVWAEVQIYESDLNAVRLGQTVEVVAADLDLKASSHISHVKPLVDKVSRAAEAHAYLDNPQHQWRPGMYVSIRVHEGEVLVPVAVKRTALQTIEGAAHVFIQTPQGFALRRVETGREDGSWVEIRQGLKAGESYVHQNSFTLKSALLSQEEE